VILNKSNLFCWLLVCLGSVACISQERGGKNPSEDYLEIRGWNILSDHKENAYKTIDAAGDYEINHLQLSHKIIHDLREVKDETKRTLCNDLIRHAHKKGIEEVTVWDHALYLLEYYPDVFKTGQGGTIDLDNPEFWEWIKTDYRYMLDLIPEVDGIILTFIETGARAEEQHSEEMKTAAEKLARILDEIAEVVINERGLKLYARTFIYTHEELENILNCLDKIKNEKVLLMVKEVPHDFFLTHPLQSYVSDLTMPVIIEFDAAHEYSGQGVIANTFVEKTAERWRFYQELPNVVGYVARTDREGTTSIINRPSEINLYTLHALNRDPGITGDQIYDDFITRKYGKEASEYIKPAFKSSYDIITSTLYTLGLCMANHSTLSCDYISTYTRFVSGRWMENPVIRIGHGVNREFHYYKDVVDHLAPRHYKEPGSRLFSEDLWLMEKSWVHPEELMNRKYLDYIIAEKDYSVDLAEEALGYIQQAKFHVSEIQYSDLYRTFYRTLVKGRLSRGAAKAYFAYRVWAANPTEHDQQLLNIFWEGIDEMSEMAEVVKREFGDSPQGEWKWTNDLATVDRYNRLMTVEGWEEYGGAVIRERILEGE